MARKTDTNKPGEEPELFTPEAPEGDPWTDEAVNTSEEVVSGTAVGEHTGAYAYGRPSQDQAFRVCPDPEWDPAVLIVHLTDESGRKIPYLVAGGIRKKVVQTYSIARLRKLVLWQTTSGRMGLWEIAATDSGNTWCASALTAVAFAKKQWVRVESDQGRGRFRTLEYPFQDQEPVWPKGERLNILKAVFTDERLITKMDHPVLSRLGTKELGGGA
jgi:hypothetical protein